MVRTAMQRFIYPERFNGSHIVRIRIYDFAEMAI